ncbi:hypothetical protein LB503_011731 [Fusarium chuoi]|nr:hypothetical protein LB503_011731 [Fusarium chuoi]
MYPIADKLMSNVGNKDIVVQSFAYTTGDYKKLGLKIEDKPVEEMQRLRDEASKILSPELANLKERVRETAELRMKKRQGGVVALNWAYAWQGGRSWLMNDLDVRKINNAAGKRPEELNQKAIMGNISATDVSLTHQSRHGGSSLILTQIGNVLDWGRRRMRSGVYPAEVSYYTFLAIF